MASLAITMAAESVTPEVTAAVDLSEAPDVAAAAPGLAGEPDGIGEGAGPAGRMAGAHALTMVNAIHVATARGRLECVMRTSSEA
ncbi:MAG: hypothetical protein ACLGIK_04255 [Gemmatimonadota bacterium]